MPSDHSILIVEDESIIALNLKMKLQQIGFDVLPLAHHGHTGIELAVTMKPQLILMDIMLAGNMNGLEAALKIFESYTPSIIYLTGNDYLLENMELAHYPVGPVLAKPVSDLKLLETIQTLLDIPLL